MKPDRQGMFPTEAEYVPTLRLGLRWTPADEQAAQRARLEADHLRGEDPDLE